MFISIFLVNCTRYFSLFSSNFIATLLLIFLFPITFLIFFVNSLNNYSVTACIATLNVSTTFSLPEFVFFGLFVFIVPLTLTLLIKQEKWTTQYCVFFFVFIFTVVVFMCTTQSLVGLVLGYELLFLPSFFVMRRTSYSAASQSAYSVFTVWSVTGSLLVVASTVFVYLKTNEHLFSALQPLTNNWTDQEKLIVSVLFFIGFGVKIPVWPFHYWLSRVHVEASTGFSIFLSGFLVKSAVYCCWKIFWSLGLAVEHPLFTVICLISTLDGVIKLAVQSDLKKLVAFATIFEMGIIYLFLIWHPAQNALFVFLFSFSHAFLSAFMFFLVPLSVTDWADFSRRV